MIDKIIDDQVRRYLTVEFQRMLDSAEYIRRMLQAHPEAFSEAIRLFDDGWRIGQIEDGRVALWRYWPSGEGLKAVGFEAIITALSTLTELRQPELDWVDHGLWLLSRTEWPPRDLGWLEVAQAMADEAMAKMD